MRLSFTIASLYYKSLSFPLSGIPSADGISDRKAYKGHSRRLPEVKIWEKEDHRNVQSADRCVALPRGLSTGLTGKRRIRSAATVDDDILLKYLARIISGFHIAKIQGNEVLLLRVKAGQVPDKLKSAKNVPDYRCGGH